MTPGFDMQQMPDTTLAQHIFQLRLFSSKISCADGCLNRPTSASRQLGILAFSSDSNFVVDVEFARAKSGTSNRDSLPRSRSPVPRGPDLCCWLILLHGKTPL